MKRITQLTILFLLIFSSCLYSQPEWQQIEGPYGGIVLSYAQNDSIAFAGTQGGGLYMSRDYGVTWKHASEGLPFIDIHILLFNNNRILVVNRDNGLYYSDDNGDTWNIGNSGLSTINISTLVEMDGRLYCSTRGAGVFTSTNNGESWIPKNQGFKNLTVNNIHVYRGALYAATNDGVYVSGNKAESWGAIRPTGVYNFVAVNENNIFIATNFQVWLTTNNGQDWDMAEYGYGLGTGTIYSLISTGPYIMAGRSTGMFVSTYSSGQWVNVHSSLSGYRVYSLVKFNNFLYAGTSKGVFFSQDFGFKWTESNKGINNERIICLQKDGNRMFAGLLDNGLMMSTDNGSNWEEMELNSGRVNDILKFNDTMYVLTNNNVLFTNTYGILWEERALGLESKTINSLYRYKGILYACTNTGIWETTNYGMTWFTHSKFLEDYRILNMYVDKNGYFYLASTNKVLLSYDGAKTWKESYMGMESYNITVVTGDDSLLLAGSYPEEDFDADVYISIDQGRNWKPANLKLSDSYIDDIVLKDNNIYASVLSTNLIDNDGIMFSSNYGKSWNKLNNGLNITYITDLTLSGNQILAGTYGAGISWIDNPEKLVPPELLYPANSSKDVVLTPMMDWETIEGAYSYRIQVSKQMESFDKHIVSDASTTISEFKIPDSLLKNDNLYYWRVSVIKNSRQSDWSEIYNFKTEKILPTVTTLLSPQDLAVDVSVIAELSWQSLTDAEEYTVQISASDLFDVNIIEETVAANTFQIPKGKLNFTSKYYWRVKAKIHGSYRDWSSVFSFTTLELVLSTPELISPVNDATELTFDIALEWNTVQNADEYIIEISKDNNFTSPVYVDTISQTIINLNKNNLEYETHYFWRIKAKFLTYESSWSPVWNFTTAQEISVNENYLNQNSIIDITPNPVINEFTIRYTLPLATELIIVINDLNGNEIRQISDNYYNKPGETIINTIALSSIANGLYFITFKTKTGNISKKIVIGK